MGWSSPNTDPNALLLASVAPSAAPSLLSHGLRALGRFGLAIWSVRTGDVLPWFTSLRPEVRWALVACVTVAPVLGFYQSVASSAATRTTQALTPAPALPAAASAPEATTLAAPTSVVQPQLHAEQAPRAEPPPSAEAQSPVLEATTGLEEQAPPSAEPSAPPAHKHRKSAKKAKPRATKHTTKASSRRHPKSDAE
jgi:hypothetical protein